MLLLITNPNLAVILLSLWYIQFNSKRHTNLIFSCLFLNGSLNAGLKNVFQFPLHESIYNNHCWYSFPSGHMQYAILFWGIVWVHTSYNLKFLLIITLLLIASGWSMDQHNYHTPMEMIGAILPAAAILSLYIIIVKRINLKQNNLIWFNITIISIELIVLSLIQSPCEYYKFSWMWLNLGATLGFSSISLIIQDRSENIWHELKRRVKSPLFYCISLLSIAELILIYRVMNIYKSDIASFICGILMPIVLFLTSKLYQKFNTSNG